MLTSASQLLFSATHNQVYFREIKIIVPKTWSKRQDFKQRPIPPLTDSFISVDTGDKFKAPQTKGHFICGKGGHYMHLTTNFLLHVGKTNWGHHGMV